MEFEHLTSLSGAPHRGIRLTDVDLEALSDEQCLDIGRLLARHLIVVVPEAHVSKERFWSICTKIGQIHGTARDYAPSYSSDSESEELFGYFYKRGGELHLPGLMRVSGIRDEAGHATGMFAQGELGWHTNHAGQRHPFPNVGLHGVQGTEGTFTDILECVSPFEALDDEWKARVRNVKVRYRWRPHAVTAGGTDAQDEQFRFNQVTEGEGNTLVRASPGGLEGLHFSEHLIDRFEGHSEAEQAEICAHVHRAIHHDAYKYRHRWRDGDVVFFDQTVCLHRRVGDTSRRLIHRIAFGFDKLLEGEPEYATDGMVLEYANEDVVSVSRRPY